MAQNAGPSTEETSSGAGLLRKKTEKQAALFACYILQLCSAESSAYCQLLPKYAHYLGAVNVVCRDVREDGGNV